MLMTEGSIDYWAVKFATAEDLKAAYRFLPISSETSPYVALVEEGRMNESEIKAALASMGLRHDAFEISRTEITKEDMWPYWADDHEDDEQANVATP